MTRVITLTPEEIGELCKEKARRELSNSSTWDSEAREHVYKYHERLEVYYNNGKLSSVDVIFNEKEPKS